jgi:hypothetical protein
MVLVKRSQGGHMSAELYGAEITGATARPAIDILPTAPARKRKGDDDTDVTQHIVDASTHDPATGTDGFPDWPTPDLAQDGLADWSAAETAPVVVVAPAPAPAVSEPAETPAPRKVFGMTVRRPRKDPAPEPSVTTGSDFPVPPVALPAPAVASPLALVVALPTHPPLQAPPVEAPIELAPPIKAPVGQALVPADAPVGPPVQLDLIPPPPPAPAGDPAVEEVRALRTLLEASENARAFAESRASTAEARATHAEGYAAQVAAHVAQSQSRATQAEALVEAAELKARMAQSESVTRIEAAEQQARTADSEAEDWQIRHREAHQALEELAASLGAAEGRLAEVTESLRMTTEERAEIVTALHPVTARTDLSH